MSSYRYAECGLDNVLIEGMDAIVDDDGENVVTIPNIGGLHRAIAHGIIRKKCGMTGKELRYLRTELGMTQAELAALVNREALAVSRWERGEVLLDSNAEVLIRCCAAETLNLPANASVREIAGWCMAGVVENPLVIDGSDPSNYTLKAAA